MIQHGESRRILVTGGAGYIGSHVCRALAQSGFLPITYDDLSHGHDWAVRWGPMEIGDLLDRHRLEDVLRRYRPLAVIHLAGLIAAGDSMGEPASYFRANLTGTLSLLDAMRACSVHGIVYSSSAGVYGEPDRLPIDESHPQRPVSPYGASKAMAERLLADYAAAYGMRSAALRYFNAVGAAAEDGIGEAHPHETHLVPLVLDVAAGARPHIEIYGDDFPTSDGTCVRDYVHVCDLADAHVLALSHLDHSSGSDAFNLGSDSGATVREVIDMAARVTRRPIGISVKTRRPGDPAMLVADSSRARRVLGWCPGYGSLEQQIASAWQWHQRYRQADRRRAVGSK